MTKIADIDQWYPAAGAEIHRLERVAEEAGHHSIKWAYAPPARGVGQIAFDLPLCASCQAGAVA